MMLAGEMRCGHLLGDVGGMVSFGFGFNFRIEDEELPTAREKNV